MGVGVDTILVGFGCPRAGTTFLESCLRSIPGRVLAFKMNEHVSFHPCRSASGLLEFERAFHAHRCVFVRIVRDPLEIARSFVFTRRRAAAFGGLARNSNERIVKWIWSESHNVRWQRSQTLHGRTSGRLTIVTVRYEDLAARGYREELADVIAGTARLSEVQQRAFFVALGDFGRRSKRPGRLSFGFEDDPLTEDELDYFTRELAAIRKREGYA